MNVWVDAGKEIDTVKSVPATEMAANYEAYADRIFDVRKPGEHLSEHVLNAHHAPLSSLNEHLAEFPQDGEFYVHCAGGYRSMVAASILKARGIHNMIDVQGGYGAIKETNAPKSDYVCPSTL